MPIKILRLQQRPTTHPDTSQLTTTTATLHPELHQSRKTQKNSELPLFTAFTEYRNFALFPKKHKTKLETKKETLL